MYWLIVLPLFLGLGIFAIKKSDDLGNPAGFAFSVLFTIVMSLVLFSFAAKIVLLQPKEINNFEQQKAYIETHAPASTIEDAAITSKKVELNEWLYNAQFSKQRYGGWSMYSGKVLELEPIE